MSETHPYRARREQGSSPEELRDLFAENVVFNSPILKKPVKGRDLVLEVMKKSVQVRDGRYTAEFRTGNQTVLVWTGMIEDMPLQSFELIEDDANGLIVSRTVAMRSFQALCVFRDAMRKELRDILSDDYW